MCAPAMPSVVLAAKRGFPVELGQQSDFESQLGFRFGRQAGAGSDGGRNDQTHVGYPVVNSVSRRQDTGTT